MRAKPNHPLAKKTLQAWRIVGLLEWLFYLLIPIGYGLAVWYFEFPLWPTYIIVVAIILLGYFKVILIPKLKWNNWKYKVFENEVELMYGVFVIRRVIIPMIRVQHVDTKQGPILRYYQLASVTISTAATTHEIPGLELMAADELRDHIAKLAREADPNE
ncbi:PH domain-containing protein [Evansella cellulosilytica]|nr:PH domain-containing protein [Evansella cellulosilytica]